MDILKVSGISVHINSVQRNLSVGNILYIGKRRKRFMSYVLSLITSLDLFESFTLITLVENGFSLKEIRLKVNNYQRK